MAKDKKFNIDDKIQIKQGSENWCSPMDEYVGKIASIKKVTYRKDNDDYSYNIDIDNGSWNWWPSKGHFVYALQDDIDSRNKLLYRAEKMFSVGTKFFPAHMNDNNIRDNFHCIITDDTSFKFDNFGNIIAMVGSDVWFDNNDKYGNTTYNRVVYSSEKKKWAYIYPSATDIKQPQEDDKPIESKMEFMYKIGDEVYLKEKHHSVDPQKVIISSLVNYDNKPHYKLQKWVGDFSEKILEPTIQDTLVARTHNFNVGDWVIGNDKATKHYSITIKGWSGQVTKVRDTNGFINIKGEYNKNNDEYINLDPDLFDLTTELTISLTPAYYNITSIDQSHDKLRMNSSCNISLLNVIKPTVEELPTLKVKKVSFKRI